MRPMFLAAILLLAVLERTSLFPVTPPDFRIFLGPWFGHIVQHGPIQAFAHPFSNYTPAYLYVLALGSLAHDLLPALTIIKLLSIAGTLFLALGVANLLKAAGADPRPAAIVLVLPSVVVNDALLAQCDALWAGCGIFGLAAMVRGRTLSAMLWCGLAVAFKAQAAFIAPVMVGAMIGRRAPWWQWPVPALVFLATLLLPWSLGWPAGDLLTVYLGQFAQNQLAGLLSNPWIAATLFTQDGASGLFWIGYVAALVGAGIIGALAAAYARDSRVLILLAALAGTALPFLLPKMLERYYFLGDAMTLALVLTWRRPGAWIPFVAVQLASMAAHASYMLAERPWPTLVGAGFATVGLWVMLRMIAPYAAELMPKAPRSGFSDR